MPDYVVTAVDRPGFPGFFKLEKAEAAPSPAAPAAPTDRDRFAGEFNRLMDDLAALSDPPAPVAAGSAALRAAKAAIRDTLIVPKLRDIADSFCADPASHQEWRDAMLLVKGEYLAHRDRLAAQLFLVDIERDKKGNATDLHVIVASGSANNTVPDAKRDLYVGIAGALNVITACCDRMKRKDKRAEEAPKILDDYVRKITGCARIGLEGDHPILAQEVLKGIKSEFHAREAAAIKTAASQALLTMAAAFTAGFALLYFVFAWLCWDWKGWAFFADRKEYFLLLAGAALGTWLSFSIRNLDLTFEELGQLEDDYLGPFIRIVFVVGLTLTLGLVIRSGLIEISIGNTKIVSAISGSTALLLGIFSGLSERALASALSSRAAGVVKSIAAT